MLGGDYIGVDVNYHAIDLARRKHQKGLFIRSRIEDFHFIKEYFDIVFCHAILQHTNIATKTKLLPNILKGLKEGGLVIAEEKHDVEDKRSAEQVTYYDVAGWRNLFSSYGFEFVLVHENGMVFRK